MSRPDFEKSQAYWDQVFAFDWAVVVVKKSLLHLLRWVLERKEREKREVLVFLPRSPQAIKSKKEFLRLWSKIILLPDAYDIKLFFFDNDAAVK